MSKQPTREELEGAAETLSDMRNLKSLFSAEADACRLGAAALRFVARVQTEAIMMYLDNRGPRVTPIMVGRRLRMGSGSFPLGGDEGKKLTQAADLVAEVVASIEEDIYTRDSGGGQFDNAALDGGSLALLRLAERLIRQEVRAPRKEASDGV